MVVQLQAQSAAVSSGQKVQGSTRLVPDRFPLSERCPSDSPRVWLLVRGGRSLGDYCADETTRTDDHDSSSNTQHTRNHDNMDRPNSALFDVFLRLRPSDAVRERFLDVDRNTSAAAPTHITIKPPVDDKRKRAVERFGFTRVFEEDAGQLELFRGTGAVSMIEGVLGARGREGRDGVLATLGVTGSGKVCREAKEMRAEGDENWLLADSY